MRGLASRRRAAFSDRVGREREAAGDLAQDDAAVALGVVLAQAVERLDDLVLGLLAGLGEVVERHRVGRQEEQRLDDPREVLHAGLLAHALPALIVIGPKVSDCSQSASPAL